MKQLLRLTSALICLLCLFISPASALAEEAQSLAQDATVWSVEAKFSRMFDSYTSYEFGNPVPPYQAPLSRLEFDLNTWWGGVEVKRWTPLWSISLEAMTNMSNRVDGMLADSDWEDGNHPKVRDIYSESDLRLKPSYMFNLSADVSVAKLFSLPQGLDLRPVGGVRWQYFDFMASNMTQWETLSDGSVDVFHYDGDVIRFKQTYWHYFVGLRLDWQPMPQDCPGFRIWFQGDWAYVTGSNSDHHLLRAGNRITEERTGGHAWHAKLALDAPVVENFFIGVQAEYMTIDTSGSHRWYNDAPDYEFDETSDYGVNVWSQQCTFSLNFRYDF